MSGGDSGSPPRDARSSVPRSSSPRVAPSRVNRRSPVFWLAMSWRYPAPRTGMPDPRSGPAATRQASVLARARFGHRTVHLGLDLVGHEPAAAALELRRERVRDDALVPVHERLEPVTRDVGRVVLLARADLGVLEARALEELRVGRPRHQRGDRHAQIRQLLAQRERERLHERLRRVVDGLERPGHRRRDRRREQDPALAALRHRLHDVLGEVDGRAAVEVDDAQVLLEVAVGERAALTDPGVECGRRERPVARGHPRPQLLDGAGTGEVDLDRLDGGPAALEVGGGLQQLAVLGSDHEVVAVVGELPGELEADPGRGAGDEGEWAVGGGFHVEGAARTGPGGAPASSLCGLSALLKLRQAPCRTVLPCPSTRWPPSALPVSLPPSAARASRRWSSTATPPPPTRRPPPPRPAPLATWWTTRRRAACTTARTRPWRSSAPPARKARRRAPDSSSRPTASSSPTTTSSTAPSR